MKNLTKVIFATMLANLAIVSSVLPMENPFDHDVMDDMVASILGPNKQDSTTKIGALISSGLTPNTRRVLEPPVTNLEQEQEDFQQEDLDQQAVDQLEQEEYVRSRIALYEQDQALKNQEEQTVFQAPTRFQQVNKIVKNFISTHPAIAAKIADGTISLISIVGMCLTLTDPNLGAALSVLELGILLRTVNSCLISPVCKGIGYLSDRTGLTGLVNRSSLIRRMKGSSVGRFVANHPRFAKAFSYITGSY